MTSPLVLTTPLPAGTLLVTGFQGREEISGLFSYEIDLVAANTASVPFDQLIDQPITLTITMPGGGRRFLNGICSRFSQGDRRGSLTAYQMEVVPFLWRLSLGSRSQIFQNKSVPDVLRSVLHDVTTDFKIKGTFEPRDYCVQYRESDFNFASRLMEEEGIFYFFEHSAGGHTMVVSDDPSSFTSVAAPSTVQFSPTPPTRADTATVFSWTKTQALRAGRASLRDYDFEMPDNALQFSEKTPDAVRVGVVTHHLLLGNDNLELYDYPGGYAKRYDSINSGGGEDPGALNAVIADGSRTTRLRMQAEAAHAIIVVARSSCRQFLPGHLFTLAGHFNGNGKYLLASVTHSAKVTGDPSDATQSTVDYHNGFACMPLGLPFRPERNTPRPVVQGSQTAFVVGPAGTQVFTDKYGRVKVQFHWDREGHSDANSSCWIRVAALHAGSEGGFVPSPRIGQEVVVDFLEGDPDQPIIVGSVYNARNPPPTPGGG